MPSSKWPNEPRAARSRFFSQFPRQEMDHATGKLLFGSGRSRRPCHHHRVGQRTTFAPVFGRSSQHPDGRAPRDAFQARQLPQPPPVRQTWIFPRLPPQQAADCGLSAVLWRRLRADLSELSAPMRSALRAPLRIRLSAQQFLLPRQWLGILVQFLAVCQTQEFGFVESRRNPKPKRGDAADCRFAPAFASGYALIRGVRSCA